MDEPTISVNRKSRRNLLPKARKVLSLNTSEEEMKESWPEYQKLRKCAKKIIDTNADASSSIAFVEQLQKLNGILNVENE